MAYIATFKNRSTIIDHGLPAQIQETDPWILLFYPLYDLDQSVQFRTNRANLTTRFEESLDHKPIGK